MVVNQHDRPPMNSKLTILVVLIATLLVTACENRGEGGTKTPSGVAAMAQPVSNAAGRALFEKNCSQCHGRFAQGATDWRRRMSNGLWPPPPLDGSGHAWHHSRTALIDKIRFGAAPGQGTMPAFETRLSRKEIDAILDWIQSRWPAEIYRNWQRRQSAN